MSESQVENESVSGVTAEVLENDSIKKTEADVLEVNKSENATASKSIEDKVAAEDDLEDGEIDDDDEEMDESNVADSKTVGTVPPTVPPTVPTVVTTNKVTPPSLPAKNMMVIDMINDMGKKSKSKSSKHQVVEADDFAGSIESAIAAALKKDGIMPPMPKILESRDESDKKGEKESSLSKSSRRRKRRKLRDDREKEKEKKKHRSSTPDAKKAAALAAAIEEELDDDEMLCVRGGSPPPAGMYPILPPMEPSVSSKKDLYDSDDSYTSYDSYDSAPTYQRYSSSRKKDANVSGSSSSRSKRKERNRRDDERRSEKRSRRNYDDSGGEDKYQDRHPQQPRKLELCKFYLMECCAKKDKCSYMHSDFPCKYYYLGMECVYRAACKFSHGKPLSDQLRNVLLKHLETAPKEILGTFRRISRENALNLMMTTHDKICQEHGIENTMAPPTIPTQSVVQTQAGTRSNDHSQQQQQNQQTNQQQHQQSEVIPSLLDMVIKGPPNPTDTQGASSNGNGNNSSKPEKQRKSRWCDSTKTPPVVSSSAIIKQQTNLEPPSSSAPSYLDLKNLTGILSTDRIEKLSKFGVVNLEQINQLTLSQLNNIGLTINEINEIQLNARNMARLGVSGVGMHADSGATNTVTTTLTESSNSLPSSQDVDMRFLPSCLPLTTTTITTSTVTSDKFMTDIGHSVLEATQSKARTSPIHPTTLVESRPSDTQVGSSNISGIDYSQYLRDSNLGYDKNDMLDDEKDEEQLVIDDQDLDGLDDSSHTHDPEIKDSSDNESKVSYGYGGIGDSNDQRLPPKIPEPDKLQQILKDPYAVGISEIANSKENSSDKINKSFDSKSYTKHYNDNENDDDEGSFYLKSVKIKSQSYRDVDSRDDYRDPRHRESTRDEFRDPRHHLHPPEPKDEYRDPRLISSSRSSSVKESKGRSTLLYKANIRSDDDSDRDRSRSRSPSRSRSRSHSPISSISPHHRNQLEHFQPIYERSSMYDWKPKCVQEDQEYSRRNTKADKDMRLAGFLDSSNSDIDLRLPFQPVKNIQIAKEIDGSMSTLMPITYKVYELDIPDPKYSELRQSFQSEDTADPRLRRILGLPELSNSKALAALGRPSRPTIASPSSVESSSSPTRSERERLAATTVTAIRGPRVDPRRAAAAAAASASASATSSSSTSVSFQTQVPQLPAGNPQQNIEIRLLLQKSDWYKNLNSKAKIMVNQQLALVSTELKRYHQDQSPNKVFDIQFIVNNQNLQEILTCLGIYIDDNGQVAHVDNDNDNNMMMGGGCGMNIGMGPGPAMDYGGGVNPMMMMNDPNMNVQQRIAMQNQMEFLCGPPPNINNMMGPMGTGGGGGPSGQGMYGGPGNMMPPYGRNPRIGMGMSPGNGGGGFNPFAGNPGDNNGGGMMDPNYCGPNNPFSNNFPPNGGNFNNQQINRGNRNQNRQGGGMMNNGNMRNQNRRFKQNRRGGGGNGGGDINMGKPSIGVSDSHDPQSVVGAITAANKTNAGDDVEESWDD